MMPFCFAGSARAGGAGCILIQVLLDEANNESALFEAVFAAIVLKMVSFVLGDKNRNLARLHFASLKQRIGVLR
jgi:hypothetical protein